MRTKLFILVAATVASLPNAHATGHSRSREHQISSSEAKKIAVDIAHVLGSSGEVRNIVVKDFSFAKPTWKVDFDLNGEKITVRVSKTNGDIRMYDNLSLLFQKQNHSKMPKFVPATAKVLNLVDSTARLTALIAPWHLDSQEVGPLGARREEKDRVVVSTKYRRITRGYPEFGAEASFTVDAVSGRVIFYWKHSPEALPGRLPKLNISQSEAISRCGYTGIQQPKSVELGWASPDHESPARLFWRISDKYQRNYVDVETGVIEKDR